MTRQVMTVDEIAEYLSMGKAKIYQLIEKKEIPASKIGKQYRFRKEAIDAWLNANIIMKDTEFLKLVDETRKDFKDAGYTQKDIEQAVAKVRKLRQKSFGT